jgi:hypothetical protein
MTGFHKWSASQVAHAIAAWIAVVFVAWLFTPAGQVIISLVQLLMHEGAPVNVALPLHSIRFWSIAALLVAVVPALTVLLIWMVRRSGRRGLAA